MALLTTVDTGASVLAFDEFFGRMYRAEVGTSNTHIKSRAISGVLLHDVTGRFDLDYTISSADVKDFVFANPSNYRTIFWVESVTGRFSTVTLKAATVTAISNNRFTGFRTPSQTSVAIPANTDGIGLFYARGAINVIFSVGTAITVRRYVPSVTGPVSFGSATTYTATSTVNKPIRGADAASNKIYIIRGDATTTGTGNIEVADYTFDSDTSTYSVGSFAAPPNFATSEGTVGYGIPQGRADDLFHYGILPYVLYTNASGVNVSRTTAAAAPPEPMEPEPPDPMRPPEPPGSVAGKTVIQNVPAGTSVVGISLFENLYYTAEADYAQSGVTGSIIRVRHRLDQTPTTVITRDPSFSGGNEYFITDLVTYTVGGRSYLVSLYRVEPSTHQHAGLRSLLYLYRFTDNRLGVSGHGRNLAALQRDIRNDFTSSNQFHGTAICYNNLSNTVDVISNRGSTIDIDQFQVNNRGTLNITPLALINSTSPTASATQRIRGADFKDGKYYILLSGTSTTGTGVVESAAYTHSSRTVATFADETDADYTPPVGRLDGLTHARNGNSVFLYTDASGASLDVEETAPDLANRRRALLGITSGATVVAAQQIGSEYYIAENRGTTTTTRGEMFKYDNITTATRTSIIDDTTTRVPGDRTLQDMIFFNTGLQIRQYDDVFRYAMFLYAKPGDRTITFLQYRIQGRENYDPTLVEGTRWRLNNPYQPNTFTFVRRTDYTYPESIGAQDGYGLFMSFYAGRQLRLIANKGKNLTLLNLSHRGIQIFPPISLTGTDNTLPIRGAYATNYQHSTTPGGIVYSRTETEDIYIVRSSGNTSERSVIEKGTGTQYIQYLTFSQHDTVTHPTFAQATDTDFITTANEGRIDDIYFQKYGIPYPVLVGTDTTGPYLLFSSLLFAPTTNESIPDQILLPGTTTTLDLSTYFNNADSFSITPTTYSWISVSGSIVTFTPQVADITTAAIDLTAVGTNIKGSVNSGFKVQVNAGAPPARITEFQPLTIRATDTHTIDLSTHFSSTTAITYTSDTSWATITGTSLLFSPQEAQVATSPNTVSITARNAGGTFIERLSIFVTTSLVEPVVRQVIGKITLRALTSHTFDLADYFTGDPAPTFAIDPAISWITLSGTTVTLAPLEANVGTVSQNVVATNSVGTATTTFDVEVLTSQYQPIASEIPSVLMVQGTTETLDLSDYFEGTAPITYSLDENTTNLGWVTIAPGTGIVTFKPPQEAVRGLAYPVIATATNALGATNGLFNITVVQAPSAPVVRRTIPDQYVVANETLLLNMNEFFTGIPQAVYTFETVAPLGSLRTFITVRGSYLVIRPLLEDIQRENFVFRVTATNQRGFTSTDFNLFVLPFRPEQITQLPGERSFPHLKTIQVPYNVNDNIRPGLRSRGVLAATFDRIYIIGYDPVHARDKLLVFDRQLNPIPKEDFYFQDTGHTGFTTVGDGFALLKRERGTNGAVSINYGGMSGLNVYNHHKDFDGAIYIYDRGGRNIRRILAPQGGSAGGNLYFPATLPNGLAYIRETDHYLVSGGYIFPQRATTDLVQALRQNDGNYRTRLVNYNPPFLPRTRATWFVGSDGSFNHVPSAITGRRTAGITSIGYRGAAILTEAAGVLGVSVIGRRDYRYNFPLIPENNDPRGIAWNGAAILVYDYNGRIYFYGEEQTARPPLVPTDQDQYLTTDFEVTYDVYRVQGDDLERILTNFKGIPRTNRRLRRVAETLSIEEQLQTVELVPRRRAGFLVPGDFLIPVDPDREDEITLQNLPLYQRLRIVTFTEAGDNDFQSIICSTQ